MGACKCNIGLGNTGVPGCVSIQSVTSSIILVPLRANDGTLNKIDLSLINTGSIIFPAFVNQLDASKRWFPLPAFENIESPREESKFEEAASGRKAFLRKGKRSFTGELWEGDATPTFLGQLNNARCVEFGIYVVDIEGNLIGYDLGDGYLYPMPVDNNSFDPMWMPPTDTTVMKIVVSFDYSLTMDDSKIAMITVAEGGINFGSLEGLKDVRLKSFVTDSAAKTVKFDAELIFGTAANKIKYKGAINPTDWIVYVNNVVTVPVSITEFPDGTYLFTFSALASGDLVRFAINTTARPGFSIGNVSVTVS